MRNRLVSCLLVGMVAANALIFIACNGDDDAGTGGGGADSGTDSRVQVGQDSGGPGDDSSTNSTMGHVTGTMDYKGTATGPMQIAFYAVYPPSGPPPYIKRINAPVWPQKWDLFVEPGHYTVLGNIIVGAEHVGLGAKDPRSPGAPGSISFDIAAGQTHDVSWTYIDPPPVDAGVDGDAADSGG